MAPQQVDIDATDEEVSPNFILSLLNSIYIIFNVNFQHMETTINGGTEWIYFSFVAS